jgi:hypothetical protein
MRRLELGIVDCRRRVRKSSGPRRWLRQGAASDIEDRPSQRHADSDCQECDHATDNSKHGARRNSLLVVRLESRQVDVPVL